MDKFDKYKARREWLLRVDAMLEAARDAVDAEAHPDLAAQIGAARLEAQAMLFRMETRS